LDGGACSTYRKENKRTLRFLWENLSARNLSKDLGVDGRIIIKKLDLKQRG
jgi:hypothetical protein